MKRTIGFFTIGLALIIQVGCGGETSVALVQTLA